MSLIARRGTEMTISELHIDTGVATVIKNRDRNSSRRSYITRHWRGNLSLAVSYWVSGVLGTLAILLGFLLLGSWLKIEPDGSPLIPAVTISAGWLFQAAVDVWWRIGVWRAAGNHSARRGRRFWAGVARVMVILGFLGFAATTAKTIPQIVEYWLIACGDPSVGKHQLHIHRGGTELEYVGGITFGATDEVRKLLDVDPAIRVIHLTSPGGRIGEARKLRDFIRERRLVTYAASECASACTLAFMGGVQRFIAPEAKLGFHRGRFPGLTEEELADVNKAERRWLIDAGVSSWFANRAYSTPSDSVWWPTLEELKRAGVITGIANPDILVRLGQRSDCPQPER
jgi:hypothetical protein